MRICVKSKIRLAKAKNTVENINNWGVLYKVSRKIKKIAVLIALDIIIWAAVWGVMTQLTQPNIIYISRAEAKTDGEIELSVKTGVVETPASQIGVSQVGVTGEPKNSPADIQEMVAKTFPEDPQTAIALFKTESGLNPKANSITDLMSDGRPFSVGLAQINLTNHSLNGVDCSKAFKGQNNHAIVINEQLYQKCVKMASDAKISLQEARKIYEANGNSFNKWGAFTSGAYLNNL